MPSHPYARILNHRSRRDVVLPPMPWTRDGAVGDRPLRERAAAMQAHAVECMKHAADVEQRDPAAVEDHLASMTGRNVAELRHRHEFVRTSQRGPFAIGFLSLTH